MADRANGVVILALGAIVAVDAGVALARSEWRLAFVELFILAVFVVPIMLSRRHRYAMRRRSKLAKNS